MWLHSGRVWDLLSRKPFRATTLIFVVIGTTLLIFMLTASHLVVNPLETQTIAERSTISLELEVIGIDAVARTIELDWYPVLTNGCQTPLTDTVAEIYVNTGYLDSSSPSFSIEGPYPPSFQLNNTATCLGIVPLTPTFRTVSKLIALNTGLEPEGHPAKSQGSSTLQNYPNDVYVNAGGTSAFTVLYRYYAPLYVYVLDHETGGHISLNITAGFGIAVNFEVKTEFTKDIPHKENVNLRLRVERSVATKFFVYAVAATNWLVAVAFLVVCAATSVYPDSEIYSEIFVLPIGAVFALTSIRSNLPGAPTGFGTLIDLYSILPVLVITSLCGCYLLLFVLYRRLFHSQRRVSSRARYSNPATRSVSTVEMKRLHRYIFGFQSTWVFTIGLSLSAGVNVIIQVTGCLQRPTGALSPDPR
ncbi:hypothetical protein C8J56DRAFT_1076472 [Mycena floridula]|nr:hypothetical protein C8J56DRAFT_1076472 [Mycena floridula]